MAVAANIGNLMMRIVSVFFSSRRRHTRYWRDWSSDVCSSDLSMATPVLTVQDLHKSFGPRVVFDGVAFAVDEGEKVGFIGVNGSGKSTLFRIVAGLEGSEEGTLAFQRGIRVGYLPQEPEFPEGATIFSAAAEGRPELMAALADYHEVAGQLARGEGDTERLRARQGQTVSRIDALGGWDFEHRLEAVLTQLGVERWERP